MRPLSARGPRIEVFGKARACLPLPLACSYSNSPTLPCYRLSEPLSYTTEPIRALLFALIDDPLFLVGFQLLDGISGAIIGVLTILVTADITHGSGRFNLAQ